MKTNSYYYYLILLKLHAAATAFFRNDFLYNCITNIQHILCACIIINIFLRAF